MTTVLEILGVIFAVWVVVGVAALWWLARRNRVTPDARTGAPLHWLAAPSRAAGVHRRLRRAVAAARAAIAVDGPAQAELVSCVASLERQAVDLDHRLVVAARCPPATRWKLVGQLEPQVREVEGIGGRLAAIAVLGAAETSSAETSSGGPAMPVADAVAALDARLAALTAARVELDALEDDQAHGAAGPVTPGVHALPSPAIPPIGASGPRAVPEPAPRIQT